eukprot:363643-Chlamydomonas_euryale.AAC.12
MSCAVRCAATFARAASRWVARLQSVLGGRAGGGGGSAGEATSGLRPTLRTQACNSDTSSRSSLAGGPSFRTRRDRGENCASTDAGRDRRTLSSTYHAVALSTARVPLRGDRRRRRSRAAAVLHP